jgi:uncharacterized protein
MSLELPRSAAWEHLDARTGFEVLFIEERPAGWRFVGQTSAVEAGEAWKVGYSIEVDAEWRTRSALIQGRSESGDAAVQLESDGAGRWWTEGNELGHLDGCFDVDLEASAFTNTLPVRRMRLAIGAGAEAPATYVRASGLAVERLEQHYARLSDGAAGERYDYESPGFGFRCEIEYDEAGLTLAYPGIARRVR